MIRGLVGKKLGMTQIFNKDGNVTPVTVIEVGPCKILRLKEDPKKVTIGFGEIKEKHVKRPILGFYKKIGLPAMGMMKEFESSDNKDYQVGQEVKANIFKSGEFVDVTAASKGKGFQGGMKRWNWKGGPTGHGSMHHRRVGSIGSSAEPSRTYVGQHMPGHMGAESVTVQGLRVMQIDEKNNLLLIKGAVPGHRDAFVTVLRSKKKAYKSLDEKPATVIKKRNPMKQSKAKAKGK